MLFYVLWFDTIWKLSEKTNKNGFVLTSEFFSIVFNSETSSKEKLHNRRWLWQPGKIVRRHIWRRDGLLTGFWQILSFTPWWIRIFSSPTSFTFISLLSSCTKDQQHLHHLVSPTKLKLTPQLELFKIASITTFILEGPFEPISKKMRYFSILKTDE